MISMSGHLSLSVLVVIIILLWQLHTSAYMNHVTTASNHRELLLFFTFFFYSEKCSVQNEYVPQLVPQSLAFVKAARHLHFLHYSFYSIADGSPGMEDKEFHNIQTHVLKLKPKSVGKEKKDKLYLPFAVSQVTSRIITCSNVLAL